jgi:nitrilase
MTKLKVAAIQMTSTPNWQENLATAGKLVGDAATNGAQLIVLPEFFIRIGNSSLDYMLEIAEEIGVGKIQDYLKNLAAKYNVFLVAGTIPIRSKSTKKCYNTTIVYNNLGEIICYYNKVHLFKIDHLQHQIDESSYFQHGKDIVTFNYGKFSFGLAICYDLRFPELFREMTGVDAIIIPAAFTYYTGQFHWEVLLRARAIENQCYVIAAAQTGTHQNGRQTFGHSMIIDPWGNVDEVLADGEGAAIATIDKNRIEQIRSELPALQNRQL